MITQLFSVYDSKARCFAPPFCCPTKEVAMRTFGEAANDPATRVAKFAEDFTLYHVGTFDDELGVVKMLSEHINLGLASNYRSRQA